MHDLALAAAWQIKIAHEDIAGIEVTRIAIPLWPSLVVVITRVGFRLLVAGARPAAKVRPAIVVVAVAVTL